MATNTYVALATQTFTSSTASITFSSIPQGYTDLIVVASLNLSGFEGLAYRCNGDTGTNYSATALYGTGSVAGSFRQTNGTYALFADGTSSRGQFMLQFQNYSNTTTNKTALSRSGFADRDTQTYASMWRSTAAINSITLFQEVNNFTSGTISLYGIAAASVGAKATGGTIYQDSTYYYHVFAGNGTFTPTQSISADVLVVAGGGGGGGGGSTWANGGGGGAGGVLAFTSQSLTATNYTCTVGAGGNGGATYTKGSTGVDSQFGALTLVKGGGAGGGYSDGTGATGGSGGGGGGLANVGNSGGSATSGQGYAGGNGFNNASSDGNGGGGGGVGGVGQAAGVRGSLYGGNGGAGTNAYLSWLTTVGITSDGYIAGGGGGGAGTVGNYGIATAGGGNGGNGNANGTNGVVYTGGGGGGCGAAGSGGGTTGGNGGSGLVIVRYAK